MGLSFSRPDAAGAVWGAGRLETGPYNAMSVAVPADGGWGNTPGDASGGMGMAVHWGSIPERRRGGACVLALLAERRPDMQTFMLVQMPIKALVILAVSGNGARGTA
jgi:hypothetical protein